MINLLIYINEPCILFRHQRQLDAVYDKHLVCRIDIIEIQTLHRGSLAVYVMDMTQW